MLSLEQKENNFTKILHDAASELKCIFYEDSGEGHDMVTDTLYCEDVSGWLIPLHRKDEFAKSDRNDNKWNRFFCFAEWRQEGDDIKIDFKKYPIYIDKAVSAG